MEYFDSLFDDFGKDIIIILKYHPIIAGRIAQP